MLRQCVLFLLFTILLPQFGWAESFETVPTATFKNSEGVPSTALSLFPAPVADSPEAKGYLILFWAGWCVPCKAELALIAANQEKLLRWNVVAVNVDDSVASTRAQGILKSIQWPFASLYDESGTQFYQINSSGELPLALAFDPQGHMLQVIRELKEPTLESLAATQFATTKSQRWEISEETHFIRRQRSDGNSDVGAATLGARFATQHWQVGATENLIQQKRDPKLGWTRAEDELGPSYIQWQNSSAGSARARLGDDSVEWGKGALLSARAIPGTDINASLQGAHWSQTLGSFSYALTAGRVRQQLFGLQLDPTLDLTQEIPREHAYGLTANKLFKFSSGLNTKLTAGFVAYHRDALAAISTTYLTPYQDQRAHLNLALSQETWGVDVAHTRYFIETAQDPTLKSSNSSQVDAYLRTQATAQYQLGATYLEKHDAIPRTFTPVLTEYPATPLTIDGLRTWRLAPRATFGKWMVEPQWIAEQSNRRDDFEKQNSYVMQVLKPESEFKTILLYQQHGSNPLATDASQMAGVLGFPFSHSVATQLEYKGYTARGRNGNRASDQSGRSVAAQLSLKIERALRWTWVGQLMLSVTGTEQDGYYLATSGIADKHLMGYRLTWTRGPLELRVAACQEPGGLICSGGVCAQRPPLDGFAVESKMHWNF